MFASLALVSLSQWELFGYSTLLAVASDQRLCAVSQARRSSFKADLNPSWNLVCTAYVFSPDTQGSLFFFIVV